MTLHELTTKVKEMEDALLAARNEAETRVEILREELLPLRDPLLPGSPQAAEWFYNEINDKIAHQQALLEQYRKALE